MIKPLNQNLLIKPEEFKHQSDTGIIYTTTTMEMPSCGIVLDLSPDCKNDLQIGMKVYYGKWAGSKVIFQNEEYLIVHEQDILCYE